MFIMTITKRRILRLAVFLLVLLTGVAIGVFAILTSIKTTAEGVMLPIYSVERQDNKISLTFDCAWGDSNTAKILDMLAKENIKATFFVTGEFCDKYPDTVRAMANGGHDVANHSDKHIHPVGANVNDLIADTKECSRKIEMLTGVYPTLYRTPYGEFDDKVITTISGMGYSVIQWNIDSIDWDKPTPQQIIDRTTKNIPQGSILLFHNDLENTEEALPGIIASLKSQGFEFVPVSELIYTENYITDSNGRQHLTDDMAAIIFSQNRAVNSAFTSLAENLSVAEIEQLDKYGMNPTLAKRTAEFLTREEIAAIQTLSYEELKVLFVKLKGAVYDRVQQNAGFDENYNDEPYFTETTPPATTPTPIISMDKDEGVPSKTE